MLKIPSKKTRPASVKAALVSYLTKGGDYNSEFDAVFAKLDALRVQAIAADAKISAVKSYLVQIFHLASKFPVGGGKPEIPLSYNWRNAFQENLVGSDGTLILEKAASLFNLAALHTCEGEKLDDPDAMKVCCEHWSAAAAKFKYIRIALVPNLGAAGYDLKAACLQALENACYAAVQAAVLRRASAKGMKPQNLASLSAGVVALLERSMESMQSDSGVRELLADVPMGQLLPLQLQYYRLVSHMHQAEMKKLEAEETASGYGHYVARLRLANNLVGSLKAKLPRQAWAQSLSNNVAEIAKTFAEKLELAEEENRLLYVEVIPPVSDLSDVKPHIMKSADEARAEPFDEAAFLTSEASIFGSMSPEMIKLKQMIKAQAEQLKSIVPARLDHQEQVKAALEGTADTTACAATGGGPTPELWAKVAEFQAKGLKGLNDDIENVKKLRKTLLDQLESMEKNVADEAAADGAHRAAHGSAWTLPPSSEAAKAIKANLENFRKQIEQAGGGDAHTAKTLETHTPLLQWLSTPKADLEAEASAPPAGATNAPNPQKFLDVTIAKLTTSRDESDAVFNQLVEALGSLDIEAGVAALPADTATADLSASVSTVLAQPIQLHQQLTQAIEAQKAMCTSVTSLRASVNKFKADASSGSSQKLAELRKKLEDGVARFGEISNFIGQGSKYYTSLQPLADQHATSVVKYCSAREAGAKAAIQAVEQKKQQAAAEAARQKQIADSLKKAQEREAQIQAQRLQAQREAEAREAQRQQELQRQQEIARQRALNPPVPQRAPNPPVPPQVPVASHPGLMSLTVTIPPGAVPGGQFRARLPDGRECVVSVPAGMYPGSKLTINVPVAPPVVMPVPTAAPVPAPLPVPVPPAGFRPPHSGIQAPAFDMRIYNGPQQEAIHQMKNFALNSSYEQCVDYLFRNGWDVQRAVQAFYSDNTPR